MSAPAPRGHDRTKVALDNEEDPLDAMISRTGCSNAHYAVQECMAKHQDWRKCQQQVEQFKGCMAMYRKQKTEELQRRRKLSRETS
ncbi:cytochrome c oxidase assembly factor 4 homolog, mitochondrial [Ambystoma mexicanum]|uniref:cytochrome c oxidase assembly factor 4 homolog, mitochondrial n=1 Tax=Ambystoma mexicanum TaxID=8296 RepID=UPI0037E8DFE5